MKKITLLILCAIFSVSAHAGVLEDCIKKIEADNANWQQELFGSAGIFAGIEENTEITEDIITPHIEQLHSLIAYNIYETCKNNINIIARKDRGHISFVHNKRKYGLDFSIEKMFDYITEQIGFLVIDRRDLKPGSKISTDDLEEGKYFYSSDCSDHFIWWNLNNSSPVNVAGQTVFTELGGNKQEYFLDFPLGSSRRAFPGLVLIEKSGSTDEQIVSYRNIPTAMKKIKLFTDKLHGTACGGQNLASYLVILNVKNDKSSYSHWWNTYFKIFSTLGIGFLTPTKIERIKELEIIDGPYNIR